jgi:hypothetical protein
MEEIEYSSYLETCISTKYVPNKKFSANHYNICSSLKHRLVCTHALIEDKNQAAM